MNEIRLSGILNNLEIRRAPSGDVATARLDFSNKCPQILLVAANAHVRQLEEFEDGQLAYIEGRLVREPATESFAILVDKAHHRTKVNRTERRDFWNNPKARAEAAEQ